MHGEHVSKLAWYGVRFWYGPLFASQSRAAHLPARQGSNPLRPTMKKAFIAIFTLLLLIEVFATLIYVDDPGISGLKIAGKYISVDSSLPYYFYQTGLLILYPLWVLILNIPGDKTTNFYFFHYLLLIPYNLAITYIIVSLLKLRMPHTTKSKKQT